MRARSSSHMIRFLSAQLKRACLHLFPCRKSAPAWAMVAAWRRTTRVILTLPRLCKPPKEPALMLYPALTGTQSSHAIKRRGRQEGEIWICHAMLIIFPDVFLVDTSLDLCILLCTNFVSTELLQIWQAGSVWITQSSCWWQAKDQGAFCKGTPDINLASSSTKKKETD